MEETKQTVSLRRRLGRLFVLVYCAIILCVMGAVLIGDFDPSRNSAAALGSACMDVVCLLTLFILVMNIAFEKGSMSRTTKLFMGLMLGTMWALFFDFLTWSLDGSLKYGSWTFVFTIASLCSGAILAAIFIYYLCSYLDDMYDMKNIFLRAKICLVINSIAFAITITMAVTKTAFEFVDGHYQLGALYELITVLPVLTLAYMTIYTIWNVKTVGIHDVVAVVVYIVIMVGGAIIESVYGFGATYVSITVADVFIFAMLQEKLIDRTKKQKEALAEKITSQYKILESMAGIYSYVNYIDLEEMTAQRFDVNESVVEQIILDENLHSDLNKTLYEFVEDEHKDKFWAFTDLGTLPERMASEKIVTAEFILRNEGWIRAQYIRIGEITDKPLDKVIFAIRNIDEEKKSVEKWIKKSNTDEVTGFYNRHAYEEDMAQYEKDGIGTNFAYISMDVNGLKVANDTMGHEAGDELLVGACTCMRRVFGQYGRLYRTGGDEFVAILHTTAGGLDSLLNEFNRVTAGWKGKFINEITVSAGYVTPEEAMNISLHQVAVLADKRMYDDKSEYYQKKGIDRRGQKDAHVALLGLYDKIIRVNLTEDTYQLVNANTADRDLEKGFANRLSSWMYEFGSSGLIHPDDMVEYLKQTDLDKIREHFRKSSDPLRIFYRKRNENDEYRRFMLEIIPANDYSETSEIVFAYVKDIDR